MADPPDPPRHLRLVLPPPPLPLPPPMTRAEFQALYEELVGLTVTNLLRARKVRQAIHFTQCLRYRHRRLAMAAGAAFYAELGRHRSSMPPLFRPPPSRPARKRTGTGRTGRAAAA